MYKSLGCLFGLAAPFLTLSPSVAQSWVQGETVLVSFVANPTPFTTMNYWGWSPNAPSLSSNSVFAHSEQGDIQNIADITRFYRHQFFGEGSASASDLRISITATVSGYCAPSVEAARAHSNVWVDNNFATHGATDVNPPGATSYNSSSPFVKTIPGMNRELITVTVKPRAFGQMLNFSGIIATAEAQYNLTFSTSRKGQVLPPGGG